MRKQSKQSKQTKQSQRAKKTNPTQQQQNQQQNHENKKDAGVEVGTIYPVEITGITNEGNGVARVNGFTLFVSGALPGEQVTAQIIRKKKGYALAKTVEILSSSPQRVVSSCSYDGICGGCQLGHLAYPGQLQAKEAHVAHQMAAIGGITDRNPLPILGAAAQWEYRNRIYLHWREGKLGFFAGESKEIIPISHCALTTPIINQIIDFLQSHLKNLAAIDGLQHILIKTSNVDDTCFVALLCGGNRQKDITEKADFLLQANLPISSVWYNYGAQTSWNGYFSDAWQLLFGVEKLPVRIMGKDFLWGAKDFLQVNFAQTEVLYSVVKQLLQQISLEMSVGIAYLWDIYCGIGTIGISVAQPGQQIIGIEMVPEAIASAQENSKRNSITGYYFAGLCEKLLSRFTGKTPPRELGEDAVMLHQQLEKNNGMAQSVAILDPPRQGCAETVLAACVEAGFPYLIYISCHSASLARDVKYLTTQGYAVKVMQPVDLFPQTGHCEVVVCLEKQPGQPR